MAFVVHNQDKAGGSDFLPLSEGMHPAVWVGLVNTGLHDNTYDRSKPPNKKMVIIFQVLDPADEGRRKNAVIHETMTLGDLGNLRKYCGAWFGSLGVELDAIDEEWPAKLHNIIRGKECMLEIIHKPKTNGGVWVNIAQIIRRMDGQSYPQPDYNEGFIGWWLKFAKEHHEHGNNHIEYTEQSEQSEKIEEKDADESANSGGGSDESIPF